MAVGKLPPLGILGYAKAFPAPRDAPVAGTCIAVSRDDDVAVSGDCYVIISRDRHVIISVSGDCYVIISRDRHVIISRDRNALLRPERARSIEYLRSISLPVPVMVEDTSSSSEYGSVSPDTDLRSEPFAFTSRTKSCVEKESKIKRGFFLGIPDELFEDHSAPPSPEERDSGFFMLKKDSERRATLHRILTEDQDTVVRNLMTALGQGTEETKLKREHITTLVTSLREFVRSTDRKIIASTLSKLKLELDFDSHAISQVQMVLFGFQDAVNKVLRNHNIKPHWMFALDSIIRKAVQTAITILVPELRPHFSITSESDPADQDDLEVEEDPNGHTTHQTSEMPSAVNEDNVHTSGVSTLSSTVSHESQSAHRSLNMQLGRLKLESNRLLEELLQKEREFQVLLRQAIEEKDQEIKRLQNRTQPIICHIKSPNACSEDLELIYWLQQHQVDEDSINKRCPSLRYLKCYSRPVSLDLTQVAILSTQCEPVPVADLPCLEL
ncbi:unnamed protein product [Ranitomeya imitator]|uniref:MAP3K HisK-N-like globin domain-containing protein n=1 Tax=Ranitomeya imitator TaxID=111125 RepID=A0ABN9KR62_9NEOB|nr:unnamed protein product [Ranitomeya imitator]